MSILVLSILAIATEASESPMNGATDCGNDPENIVFTIANDIIGEIGKPGDAPDTPELERFFRVYTLDTEIGSGASFDQYFNWASSGDVEKIVEDLEAIGLNRHAVATRKAIRIAFPDGRIPEFDAASLDMDWSEPQLLELGKLYDEVSNLHGLVIEKLAKYATRQSLLSLPRFDESTK